MLEDMIRVAIQDFGNVEGMYSYVEDMYGEAGITILEQIFEDEGIQWEED